MSINNRLTNFAQKELVLGYSNTERVRINNSLMQLEKVLKDRLVDPVTMLRFGSYTRNTILPRSYDAESDVDLMVIFSTYGSPSTPETYRNKIKSTISSAYPNSISKKDYPAVKLELNHIRFDIVPAYCQENLWAGAKKYFIPNRQTGWMLTVPNDLNTPLATKNQNYGNNVVRNVIRLCKCWNAGAGYPWYSYELEKWIVDRFFYSGDNLYAKFLSVLEDIVGDRPREKQALSYIRQYQGKYWGIAANPQKEFEWLQKLLPGLS